jgi:hypothetical protein
MGLTLFFLRRLVSEEVQAVEVQTPPRLLVFWAGQVVARVVCLILHLRAQVAVQLLGRVLPAVITLPVARRIGLARVVVVPQRLAQVTAQILRSQMVATVLLRRLRVRLSIVPVVVAVERGTLAEQRLGLEVWAAAETVAPDQGLTEQTERQTQVAAVEADRIPVAEQAAQVL